MSSLPPPFSPRATTTWSAGPGTGHALQLVSAGSWMNESLKGSRHSLYSVLRAPFARQLKSRRFPKWCAVRAPCVIVSLACIFINPPWLSSHGCTGGCDLGRTVTAAGLSAVDAPATLDRAVVLMFPAMSLKQIEYATPPPCVNSPSRLCHVCLLSRVWCAVYVPGLHVWQRRLATCF
jgi:hypothetical protein